MTDYKILIHLQTPDNPDLAESVVERIWELAESYPALADEISEMEIVKMTDYKILIHLQTPDNPDLAESVVERIWELAESYPALADEISEMEIVKMSAPEKELKA